MTRLGLHTWGLCAVAVWLIAAPRSPACAENWPGWRGPDRNGVSPESGLPERWSENDGVLWRQAVTPDCSPPRNERFQACDSRFGLSAVPLVVDRSVIAGAVDGRLYIYDAATGKVVFRYDTLRDFETVNGVNGKGGGIDAHSIAAGAGMVFVGSGYGRFGQPGGNVLLAFRPRVR